MRRCAPRGARTPFFYAVHLKYLTRPARARVARHIHRRKRAYATRRSHSYLDIAARTYGYFAFFFFLRSRALQIIATLPYCIVV